MGSLYPQRLLGRRATGLDKLNFVLDEGIALVKGEGEREANNTVALQAS